LRWQRWVFAETEKCGSSHKVNSAINRKTNKPMLYIEETQRRWGTKWQTKWSNTQKDFQRVKKIINKFEKSMSERNFWPPTAKVVLAFLLLTCHGKWFNDFFLSIWPSCLPPPFSVVIALYSILFIFWEKTPLASKHIFVK
jgi:hypothetical protein